MDIRKEDIDELNALLKVQVDESDYEEKVNEVLRDYRKKANIKGFRPGKVPFGMIKKMAGTKVLVDEVNKLVFESISKYLVNEKINILGEPIVNEEKQPKIDWENQKTFEFVFDLGLSPDVNVELSKKDKIPYYKIKVDKAIVDEYVDEYKKRFGRFETTDKVSDDEMIKGELYQVDDNGQQIEEGFQVSNATLSLLNIKDDAIKKKFKGAVVNDKVVFDLKKAYPNDTEISSLLNIDNEKAAEVSGNFEIQISEILKFEEAEVNQELFDKVYGENAVKSEEEFRQKLSEDIENSLEADSNYKFVMDVKDAIIKKADIELPIEFLKRWLLTSNKEKFTKEQVDEDFHKYEDDMKWQVIRNSLINKNNITVSDEEIKDYAKQVALMQFQQYGLANMPEEQLEQFANTMLEKEEERKRLYDKKYDDKVIEFVKENVTVNEKEITRDKFKKMLEKK